MKSISTELVKARIDELQVDIERVKAELQALKQSSAGNVQAEDVQKLDELTRQILTLKSGQAELIGLLS